MQMSPPIPLGTYVKPWGKIVQVGWVGERYYWLMNKRGDIAMMPADVVENIVNLTKR